MKIRRGFVSNSSSSSFVIVGNEIEFSKIKATDKNIEMLADELAENTVCMTMTKEIFEYLKNNPDVINEKNIRFYEVIASGNEEIEIKKKDLPEKFKVYSLEIDQWSPETFKEFENAVKGE